MFTAPSLQIFAPNVADFGAYVEGVNTFESIIKLNAESGSIRRLPSADGLPAAALMTTRENKNNKNTKKTLTAVKILFFTSIQTSRDIGNDKRGEGIYYDNLILLPKIRKHKLHIC